MSETSETPTVQTLLADIAAWWQTAVDQARLEKDEVVFAKRVVSAMRAEDLDDAPFRWRETVARNNAYPACKGTVLDVADARTEVHLPFHRLLVALKTFLRLCEGHCLGMEELWDRYGMNPAKPLTKEACAVWIDGTLKDTPGIFQRAVDAASKGEGLLTDTKEAVEPSVE